MRKGASAEQDFIVAFRPSSNAAQDGAEVQLQTFEDDASPRPQITRSVSDPALRRSFDSPRSGRPRRNSTLTSNVSDFYLTVNGNHQWSPDDVAVEEDEEESGEHMRHALSDQGPNGKLELFVRSKSGVIRQMVEEEKKRWEETQEEWLYEAQQVNDFHHEAGKRWAFQRPMGGISEQMYLDDSQSVCMISARIKVSRLLQSQFFELALGLVIVANALAIGLEQSFRAEGHDTFVFDMLEYVFLGIYTAEMGLRFFVSGWRCLKDDWVKFDFILLVSGLAGSFFITPYFGFDQITPLLVLRTFRLLRLARTVKLLMKCRNLWMLVRGLMSSVGTMMPILLLLVIILYVFSALGFEMLKYHEYANGENADEEFRQIVESHFSTLTLTMMTLVQFVSMDSVAAIYRPLVKKDWTLAIYFHVLILLVFVVLMNLVTAVIVNSAFEQASQDREAQQVYEQRRKEKLVGDLVRTFQKLDLNGDGKICQDELMGASGDDLKSLYSNLKLDNPEEIFMTLDVDGTGEIDITEFCEGVLQAVTSEGSIELKRMDKQIKSMKKQLSEMERSQAGFGDLLTQALQETRFLVQSAYVNDVLPREVSVSNVNNVEEGPPAWAKAMMLELKTLREAQARTASPRVTSCCERCCNCRCGPDGRPRRGLGIRDRWCLQAPQGSPALSTAQGSPVTGRVARGKSTTSLTSSPSGFLMPTSSMTSSASGIRRPSAGRLQPRGPSPGNSLDLGSWGVSQDLRPRRAAPPPPPHAGPVREETTTSEASSSNAGAGAIERDAAARLRGILTTASRGRNSSTPTRLTDGRSSSKGTTSMTEVKVVGFTPTGRHPSARSPGSVATTLSMQRMDSSEFAAIRHIRQTPPHVHATSATVPARLLEKQEASI